MPRDKTESHIRVLAAAREEFSAYGFEKASMRRIASRCSMTAAGLYRHCKDKEDLFDQLVAPSLGRLRAWQEAHIEGYAASMQGEGPLAWRDSNIDMMREVVYPAMEDFHLLLTCSQGTRYESFLHDLTRESQEKMLGYLPLIRERNPAARDIAPEELHLLLSAYNTALFEPVIHGYPLEEALRCLDVVETFFLPGWKSLLGF